MKHYTKRNIRIRVIALCCAFIGWGIGSIILWNSNNRTPIYSTFSILFIISVSEYIEWKKSKSKTI
jgi:hypothetical protein